MLVGKEFLCFSDGSCWEIIVICIKQIHTFTSIILFEQRRFGLCCPSLYQFDLIKTVATQTETSLFKQYDAGECVDLLERVSLFVCSEATTGSRDNR